MLRFAAANISFVIHQARFHHCQMMLVKDQGFIFSLKMIQTYWPMPSVVIQQLIISTIGGNYPEGNLEEVILLNILILMILYSANFLKRTLT